MFIDIYRPVTILVTAEFLHCPLQCNLINIYGELAGFLTAKASSCQNRGKWPLFVKVSGTGPLVLIFTCTYQL